MTFRSPTRRSSRTSCCRRRRISSGLRGPSRPTDVVADAPRGPVARGGGALASVFWYWLYHGDRRLCRRRDDRGARRQGGWGAEPLCARRRDRRAVRMGYILASWGGDRPRAATIGRALAIPTRATARAKPGTRMMRWHAQTWKSLK